MAITPVSGAAFQSLTALADTATTKAPSAASTKGFGDAISGAIENLNQAHQTADTLATQAISGSAQVWLVTNQTACVFLCALLFSAHYLRAGVASTAAAG